MHGGSSEVLCLQVLSMHAAGHMNCSSGVAAWHMAHGTWHMAHGTWHMARGTWHMAHGTWHMAQLDHSNVPYQPYNGQLCGSFSVMQVWHDLCMGWHDIDNTAVMARLT